MDSSTAKRKTFAEPKPLSELLPSLGGIFKDMQQTFTDKKQPRPAGPQTLTGNKLLKPMSYAEMRANLLALKPESPKGSQPVPPSHKKGWVSSVKVDYKTVSHTANGQMRNNPVRKVLNFQPKPKPPAPPSTRKTQQITENPTFPKPQFRPKKSVYAQAKINNNIRISGVCKIPETPVETKPMPAKSRMTIANKENNPHPAKPNSACRANLNRKTIQPTPTLNIQPTPILKKPGILKPHVDIANSSSLSWKSNDDSFLQKEQEIKKQLQMQSHKPKCDPIVETALVSTPSSTPFKEYRSVQEYFNNSSEMENSAMYNDNTIMCFDRESNCPNGSTREESVIVSLCDLFNKATVNMDKADEDLDALLEMKKHAERNIKMIESGINMLNNIKQSQIDSLKKVNKLIEEHKNGRAVSESEKDKTLVGKADVPVITVTTPEPEVSPIVSRPCSVIRSHASMKSHAGVKSPSYKIPKKNTCLRKKLVYKSLPNMSTCMETPVKGIDGTALNVYMEMKEQMNFLSTPVLNRDNQVPDTPMVTSHNLQKQLDKLYNGS